ncbi:hypothetical protein ACHAW5_000979 [Stephanodiscus triporus]|uniref:RXYLT1 C-terminal domain-containing protein n=1 Tax=Stephanodiscus triporus TaxID=2934178 RepID=A0ABD3NUW1_9STRA
MINNASHGQSPHRQTRCWAKLFPAVAIAILLADKITSLNSFSEEVDLRLQPYQHPNPHRFDEHELQLYMHERRLLLLNESSVVNYLWIYNHFKDDMEMTVEGDMDCKTTNSSTREKYLEIYTDPNRGDILSGNFWDTFCCGAYGFFATSGIKKHVSMHPWDSNWGEFSEYVPGRTTNWGGVNQCYEEGNEVGLMWRYLNHTNLSAVFTVQHQFFDHPKVHSVPLGPSGNAAGVLRDSTTVPNRTNLLYLSNSDFQHRVNITQSIISNFNGMVSNRYNDGSNYFELMRHSKFVLCPSGMGWDTYRAWEALVLGTIPILETYYRKDGMYHIYDDLPVLWVDHYDNVTPALLEREYPRIISKAREYTFEKLTNQWWIDLINSYRVMKKSD